MIFFEFIDTRGPTAAIPLSSENLSSSILIVKFLYLMAFINVLHLFRVKKFSMRSRCFPYNQLGFPETEMATTVVTKKTFI